MKLNRFGVVSALVAAAAAVGCSSDTPKSGQNGENTGSISFKLTSSDGLVDFTSAHYDLSTRPALTPVLSDDISVARPESVLSLGIQALAYGDYRLRFTADGLYHNPTSGMDQPVSCTSAADPNENITVAAPTATLPTITMTCSATSGQTDSRGNVNANVNVVVVQSSEQNIVETFSYGPRSVLGYLAGGVCTFPIVNIKIKHDDATISYTWSDASDGQFLPNANTTDGTYQCLSGGTKVLTLTATNGTTTSTKQVTVVCDDTPCGFSCGDNVVQGSEQCDEGTANSALGHCSTSCVIQPSCGDGIVDGPSGVCANGKANPACTEACDPLTDSNCTTTCTIIPPVTCGNNVLDSGEDCDPPNGTTCDTACHRIPTCGDGIIDAGSGETCDDGATGTLPNNSDTLANACRTNCHVASCGDGVVNTGEQCEPPNSATCTATCQTVTVTPPTQWETCEGCISGDSDTNDIQQFFCTSTGCHDVEACIINSGCYFPNPTDCYCGIGANLDTCLQPSATVPAGPCAALYRTATGNLLTSSGTIDNAATLDASTLTNNVAGQAQAVIANVADPSAVCFGQCGFP